MFYDHNGMKVEINSRRKTGKYGIIKKHHFKNNGSKKKSLEKLENLFYMHENKITIQPDLWDHNKNIIQRETYSYKCLHYKINILNQ